jgi:hypothetical protein
MNLLALCRVLSVGIEEAQTRMGVGMPVGQAAAEVEKSS